MLHFSQVIFTYLIILPNFALLFNITKQALNAAFIALRTRANEIIIFFFVDMQELLHVKQFSSLKINIFTAFLLI